MENGSLSGDLWSLKTKKKEIRDRRCFYSKISRACIKKKKKKKKKTLKGITSDSNIFLYGMNQKMLLKKKEKKSLLPKFKLISILHLQVVHDCVHWHCSIDYCVK